ncbi:hypothetical protein [Streptomyces antimicrobicus]|uniref:Uncharacterized protein n=1 Tax=Streptomyces antimicrobicus TaxID=2883108 RepID=A0ABS8B5E7_9ACTN|nr:hypothetical protein [Streptomyces antimicrobicus]MCB5179811.1 hypothetical protein [Streptomyces antimicrobicus]
MTTCTCDFGSATGPGLLASDFLRRHLAAKEGEEKPELSNLPVLLRIAGSLRGDTPVFFDFTSHAEALGTDVPTLRGEIRWLVEHRFLALDGDVDGTARLWLNPCVAFPPFTDCRVIAARHRFPFITTVEGGMSAAEPVVVHEYDAEGWEQVYQDTVRMTDDPPCFSSDGCLLHGPRGS